MNRLVPIFICAIIFSSCASLLERKALFGEGSAPSQAVATSSDTVPKAQYDELLQKYQALQNELKPKSETVEPAEVEAETPSDMVEKLTQATKSPDMLAETVDVFGSKNKLSSKPNKHIGNSHENFENEILALRKIERLIRSNKMNDAMARLKVLEDSKDKQIKVRAKYLIGEILYRQGNYDLAMQVFEEVVHNYAFSGVILSTLKKLAICSDKLKLPKKKELYFSMLHDFF